MTRARVEPLRIVSDKILLLLRDIQKVLTGPPELLEKIRVAKKYIIYQLSAKR